MRHEEVDLERVLDQAYGAFAEEARRREIDYRLSGVETAPVIVSDGDRVLQVITNLLSNAFRWTPTAAASSSSSQPRTVRSRSTSSTPGRACRRTSARGSSRRSSLRTRDGTGLGLPIARELAVALGGGIELESTAGSGSRFRLVLPVIPAG